VPVACARFEEERQAAGKVQFNFEELRRSVGPIGRDISLDFIGERAAFRHRIRKSFEETSIVLPALRLRCRLSGVE
jgi:hypothetical protein